MFAFLAANWQYIALGLGLIWHKLTSSSAAKDDSSVVDALERIGGVFDAYMATLGATQTLDGLRVALRGLAAVQLGRLGVYEGTALRALADRAVSALVERTVAAYVRAHPSPASLHAQAAAPGPQPGDSIRAVA